MRCVVIAAATLAPVVMPASHARAQVAAPPASSLDSLLPAAMRAALAAGNPELAARRAVVASAEARLRAAGFAAPAVLSAELEEAPRGRLHEGNVRVGLDREFLTGGRREAARQTARADLLVASALLRVAERRVHATAFRAALQAVGWQAMARRLAGQDSLLIGAEGSLRTRFAVGDARYVDVLRLRTERLRVQNERALALTEARTGLVALEALFGHDSAVGDSVVRALPAWLDEFARSAAAALSATGLPAAPSVDELLEQTGLPRLADAEVTRAQATRALLLASQQPQVSAGVGVQRIAGEGGAASTVGPTLGVAISLPFTAGRANRLAAQAAEREVAAAGAERAANLAAWHGVLRAARERYEAARERLAVYDAALLRGAREERESALAAYRTGELSLLELLDFERALSSAEIERTRAVVDAAFAFADLMSGASAAAEAPRTESPSITRTSDER